MKEIIKKNYFLFILILVGIMIISIFVFREKSLPLDISNIPTNPNISNQDEVIVLETEKSQEIAESKTVLEKKISDIRIEMVIGEKSLPIPFVVGETFYDTLVRAENEGYISFSGIEYPILGFFVQSIENLQEGGGEYLMFFINGKESSVGVSQYIPNNHDVIEWKLK